MLKFQKDDAPVENVRIDPKELVNLSDRQLLDLFDNINGMLLRDEIGEEEFNALRDQIVIEMQNRGIRPTGETQRGRFSSKTRKILSDNVLRAHSTFLRLSDDATFHWDISGLQGSMKSVALRLSKLLPEDTVAKFSSEPDDEGEALYDLYLVPHGKKVEISKGKINGSHDDIAFFHQLGSASRQDRSAARSSARRDKIRAGRFFRPMPFVRGVQPEMEQKIDDIVMMYAHETFPVFVIPMKSSLHVQVHKTNGRVDIWTFDGKNITNRLPGLSKMLSQKTADHEFVFVGTIDAVDKGVIQGDHVFDSMKHREYVTFFLSLYDCLFYDGDNHMLPYKDRLDLVKEFVKEAGPETAGQIRAYEPKMANSGKHLIPTLNHIRKRSDLCGALLYDSNWYELSNYKRSTITLYEKTMLFNAIVLEVEETAAPGVVNFQIGIAAGPMNFKEEDIVYREDKAYARVGSTLSSARWSYPGDILEISTNGVLFEHDVVTGFSSIRTISPRVVNRVNDRTFPFSARSLIDKACKSHLYFSKIVEPGGMVCYLDEMSNLNPLKIFKWEQTENEVRYRVRNPELFQPKGMGDSQFKTMTIKGSKPRVGAIIGKLKGKTATSVQALRFPKEDGWTMAKAQKWVEGREFRDKRNRPLEDYVEPVEATNKS